MSTSFLEQHERALAASAYEAYLLRLKSCLGLGVPTWMLLMVLDALACRLSTHPFVDFFELRLVGLGYTAAAYLILVRVKRPHPVLARFLDVNAFVVPAVLLGFMCSWLGGLKSVYISGLSLIIACRAILMRERWFTNVLSMVPTVGGFVATLFLVEHRAGTLAAQMADPSALTFFAVGVAISLFVLAFTAFAGDALYRLERAAFEGRSLGRFKLEARIGAGAMGEIWRAHDNVLKRSVALKVIRHDAGKAETSRARFEREIRAMAALSHPNVVPIIDFGVTGDGVVYLAMELLSGADLATVVARKGPLAPSRAITLIEQAARALAHAHSRGVIHRDVKPSNIFVCDEGGDSEHVKLLDFGIAKLEDEGQSLTMTEAFVGTPAYVAPEAVAGQPSSSAGDVYSLGAVAFFALTGAPPFEALSRAGVLQAHLVRRAPRVDELRPGLPAEVGDIVARALEKSPKDRYPTAGAMAEDLRRALFRMRDVSGDLPVAAVAARAAVPSEDASTTSDDTISPVLVGASAPAHPGGM